MPGEEVVATLYRSERRISDFPDEGGRYPDYPALFLELEDGSKTIVYCSPAGLRAQVIEDPPRIGDLVGVHYEGRADDTPKAPKRYRYEVEHTDSPGEGAECDWSAFKARNGRGGGGGAALSPGDEPPVPDDVLPAEAYLDPEDY
jgi:hypothetical protein